MTRRQAIRFLASGAAVGGTFWILKGGAIILTGDQPPYLFELAPVGFAFSLWGLRLSLGPIRTRIVRIGSIAASAALVLSVAAAGASVVAEDQLSDEATFSPLSLLPLGSMVSTLAALILLGVSARKTALLGPGWRGFPLALGIGLAPMVAVGGLLLGAIHERLFEVPIVLAGLAWVLLGGLLWRSTIPPTSPANLPS